MKPKFNTLIQIPFILCTSGRYKYYPISTKTLILNPFCLFSTLLNSKETLITNVEERFDLDYEPKNPKDVFMKWGCTENDVAKIFVRAPCLRNTDPICLQSKLNVLSDLGISSCDLVKMVNCRPRLLAGHIDHSLKERVDYFNLVLGSKEVFCKAIVRNPSLLIYNFHDEIKPVIEMYNRMGVSEADLIPLIMSRPTLIPRTKFDDEKLEYIRKTGLTTESKMYKYVVCIVGISRLNTIQEKVANFEKNGFTDDEIFGLIARSPLVLTLSIDKIQRNMTFVLGTMKLPARIALDKPYLFFLNLESVLKPRVLFAKKLQDMGFMQIEEPALFTALRMKEDGFVRSFISYHPKEVANTLMEYYRKLKSVKRLAASSKPNYHKGFPF